MSSTPPPSERGASAPAPRDPGHVARGATTLDDVLTEASAAGYDTELTIEPGERIRCGACGAASGADAYTRHWTRRLEGSSDPDDLLHTSGLTCPNCAARGVLVAHYGPQAGPDEAEVLAALSPDRTPAARPTDT